MTCSRPHSDETETLTPNPDFSPLCYSASFLKFFPKHVLLRDGKQIFRDKNKVVDMNVCHPARLPGKPCCSAREGVVSRRLPATSGAASAAESSLIPGHARLSIWEQKGVQWEQSEERREGGKKRG